MAYVGSMTKSKGEVPITHAFVSSNRLPQPLKSGLTIGPKDTNSSELQGQLRKNIRDLDQVPSFSQCPLAGTTQQVYPTTKYLAEPHDQTFSVKTSPVASSPAIIISSASPEKHQRVKLLFHDNKDSGCVGTPDLGYMSGMEQSPWKRSFTSMSASPDLEVSTYGKKMSKTVDDRRNQDVDLTSPKPMTMSSWREKTPSTSLSVPSQQTTGTTPTQPPPLQTEDTPPGAPRPRHRTRRLSEEHSFFAEKLRSREARRLSIDLTKEMLSETRKLSCSAPTEDVEYVSDMLKDLRCEVDESLDSVIDEMMSDDSADMSGLKQVHDKMDDKTPNSYAEDKTVTNKTSQSDQPAVKDDLKECKIGNSVKSIKCKHSSFSKNSITKLFELQNEDGSWCLTEDLCAILGLHYDVCMQILEDAGIKSYAKKVQEDIMTLLATCIAILLIIQLESPDWVPGQLQENFWKKSLTKWLAESVEGGSHEVDEEHFPPHASMIKSIKFYHAKEAEYKWAASAMDLGKIWGEVAAKMLDMV